MNVRHAVFLAAGLAVLALGSAGCTSESAPSPVREPNYALPTTDMCRRLDFSIFSSVWGEPSPLGMGTDHDKTSTQCRHMFLGPQRASGKYGSGGLAKVYMSTYPSAAKAAARFDLEPLGQTAAPFAGIGDSRVDRARYYHEGAGTSVVLLVGNLVVEVSAASLGQKADPIAALPPLVSKFADQVVAEVLTGA